MQSNEIISYIEMCDREGLSLQRGMNFNAMKTHSVVLSSHRPGAPYDDVLEEDGTVLIYEGHDEPKTKKTPYPKQVDQPLITKSGKLTPEWLLQRGGAVLCSPRQSRVSSPGLRKNQKRYLVLQRFVCPGR